MPIPLSPLSHSHPINRSPSLFQDDNDDLIDGSTQHLFPLHPISSSPSPCPSPSLLQPPLTLPDIPASPLTPSSVIVEPNTKNGSGNIGKPDLHRLGVGEIDFDLLSSFLSVKSEKEMEHLASRLFGDNSNLDNSRAAIIAAKASSFQNSYDPSAKFTFFTASRGILQGSSLASVAGDAFMRTSRIVSSDPNMISIPKVEPFWLDVHSPSPIDLALLARIFSIHPLTLEDMTTDEAREKVEGYEGYLFMCLRTLADDADDTDGLKLKEEFYYALLFKDSCVLTVRQAPLRHAFHVALRLVTGSGLSAVTAAATVEDSKIQDREHEVLAPDWVVYCIIDDVIDSLRPVIQGLEFDADGIDDLAQILQWNEQADLLQRLRRASKKVTQLIRLLHLKEEVVKSLSNPGRSASFIHPATTVYLRDIFDHIVTLQHSLAIIKETLNTAHSGYHSQLSVAMSQLSNHMNASMKRITVIGTAFVPITAVTGCFGMNVAVPGSDRDGPYWWFFSIIVATLLVSIMVVYILEKTQRRTKLA